MIVSTEKSVSLSAVSALIAIAPVSASWNNA